MTSQTHAVPNGDVTLHFRDLGRGFPVLLLSGGPGGPAEELLPVAEHVSETHRAILLEQRGTGRSRLPALDSETIRMAAYVDDVEAVRRHLGIERWVLLGHSAGGALAMAVAAEHPETVAGLVLVESAGINLDFLAWAPGNLRHTADDAAAMQHWADPERVAEDPERASREVYRAFLGGAVFDRARVDDVMAHFVPAPDVQTISGLMMQDLTGSGFDLREPLASFEAPALIVHGREGFMGPKTAEQIHAALPASRLELLDECGHYPMYEQPDAFYGALDAFLERVSGA